MVAGVKDLPFVEILVFEAILDLDSFFGVDGDHPHHEVEGGCGQITVNLTIEVKMALGVLLEQYVEGAC